MSGARRLLAALAMLSAGGLLGACGRFSDVEKVLGAAVLRAPSPPAGVGATSSAADVTVTWTASPGATGYVVLRATTPGGPYTEVGTATGTSFTDAGVGPGTYYYVVEGINSRGKGGGSSEVTVVVGGGGGGSIAPPTGLTATGGAGKVQLTWSASAGATGYVVMRSSVPGGPYMPLGTTSDTSFTDAGAGAGTPYYYVVRAGNASGTSGDSAEASAVTAPPAPTGLVAVGGANQVSLTWNPSSGATGFQVLRGTASGGPYTAVGTTAGTTFADTGLAAGTTYYYVVRATNASGSSGDSAEANATPGGVAAPPSPTGLVAVGGANQVALVWNAPPGATGYLVLRSTASGGPYVPSGVVGGGTNFTDTGLAAGMTYYYVVQAANAGGVSPNSAEANALTISPPPTGVAAAGEQGQIQITWSAAAGAVSYVVLRSGVSGGSYTQVGTPAGTGFTDGSLAAGTVYYYVIRSVNASGTSGNSAEASATTIPAAPTGLSAAGGAGQVVLSWTASPAATGYAVLRSPVSGGPYAQVGTSGGTGFTDSSVAAGTMYYYVVRSANVSGTSGSSAPASAITIPDPPMGLIANGGNGQAYLSWIASAGATGYAVWRATVSGGPYTWAGAAGGTSFTDVGLGSGVTYYYVVRAGNGSGASGNSTEANALTIPAPPTGLTATGGTLQVSLTWSASTGATGYAVLRSTVSGGPYSAVGTVAVTSFTDTTGLGYGTTYYYVVRAANTTGTSGSSGQASAPTVPTAPTGLMAGGGPGTVVLSWTASAGATGYAVWRSTVSGGPYTQVGSPSGTSFTDMTVSSATTYYYVARAGNGSGTSANSNEANLTTGPAAPTGVTAAGGALQVVLSWNASSGATGYAVWRSTVSGGPYSWVANAASTSYTNTGLSAGTTYYYVVRAGNASGTSAYSLEANAPTFPAAPTGVTAMGGTLQVALSWSASAGATGYVVLRSTVSGGPYSPVGTVAVTSFTDTTGLAAGTQYYYVVRAGNVSGTGASSSEASGWTIPPAPAGLTATWGVGRALLSWSSAPGATGYVVLRATVSGGPYTQVGTSAATSFADGTVAPNTTCYYVVQAVDVSGRSGSSNEATVLTGPPAPTGVSATSATGQISLTWTAAPGATAYLVYRATFMVGSYQYMGSAAATTYVDSVTQWAGWIYSYVVRSTNAAGMSANSAETRAWLGTSGDGTFLTPLPNGVGTDPYSVAVGDFNGDGTPDLAAANLVGNNVSILLGNGNGTFRTAVNYGTGSAPYSVAVGDFNGDGAPDLAVANASSGNVSILLGNGDGTFRTAVNYGAGSAPYSVAVGDFNGDGTPDLAAANYSSNIVSILLGNGDGTFQAGVTYAAGSAPYSVAVGDLNGDGRLDLAVANLGSNQVSILLGNGDGTFRTAVTYGVGSAPYSVAVGDLNGDGKLDLAVANWSGGNTSILLGNGDGTFQTAVTYGAGTNPAAVAVGDLNGDGKLDLAVANFSSNNVSVLLGNGNGTFQAAVNYTAGASPRSVASGEFNGDGKLDLAVASSNGNNVSILLAAYPPPPTPTGLSASAGPGQVHLAWNASAGATGYATFRSTASGGPYAQVGTSAGTTYVDMTVAGNATYYYVVRAAALAVMSGRSNEASVLTGPPAPLGFYATGTTGQVSLTWAAAPGATAYLIYRAAFMAGTYQYLGSVAGTAYVDPVTQWAGWIYSYVVRSTNAAGTSANSAEERAWPRTSGIGTFVTAVNYGAGSLPLSVAAGDFDGDGKVDLAVANVSSNNVSILLGNGDGTFQTAVNYGAGSAPYSVAVGDFDGDGKLDLAAANNTSNTVSILLGNGNGTFQTGVTYGTGSGSESVAVGDFDGDGKLDLAVASLGAYVSVLLGNGDGTFQTAVNYGTGSGAYSVAVGDFNGDGKLDLAVASYSGSTLVILLGNGDGTFQTAVNYGAGTGPVFVALGDFNGDGKLDLAAANWGGANVSILLGNGNGTFQTAVNYGAGSDPSSVAVGDFNGDGKLDLAVANFNSNDVSVLLGNGNGTFQTAVNYGAGTAPRSVAAGDWSGDGKLDLAAANSSGGNVSVLIGK